MALSKTTTFTDQLSSPGWLVEESGFDPKKLNYYETIFTCGNGYQGTRGTLEEGFRGALPATYLAGVFDHHDSTVTDLVSAIDWLPFRIFIDGSALDMNTCRAIEHRRRLDLKKGLLHRLTVFEDNKGRRTRYESIRFASFANQHLAALRAWVTPENYSATITVESSLDGNRRNLDRLPQYVGEQDFPVETKWEKWATSKHLHELASGDEGGSVFLEMKTIERGHRLCYAASLNVSVANAERSCRKEYEKITEVFSFHAEKGETCQMDKFVAIGTSRDVPEMVLRRQVNTWLEEVKRSGFDACLQSNIEAWADKWAACECTIEGDAEAQKAVRFNIYHLLICASEKDPKVNIGAKSLSGEGYKGHVFWDTEIFLLPFYIYTQPETAKALLLYRYHCMPAALENAKKNGFRGAQFPWESAETGEETTPKWTHDGKHRIWTGEEEIHITADVAYGVLTYLTATGDWGFLLQYGAEMLFNTARFWDSRLEYKKENDRYELNRVIGPDEFHEHVDNNVFTNWLAMWNLQKAVEYFEKLKGGQHLERLTAIIRKLELTEKEVSGWAAKAKKIYIPFDREKKLIEQYEGYFRCKEEPIEEWDENGMPIYPNGRDHFTAQETTLVKQPDVVMLLYVLPDEFDDDIKRINYDFYEKRTMHKSSLSPSIHSIMGIEVGDTSKAMQYFQRAAFVDLIDNQGNTDMGMHIASAGGTWMCMTFGFGGLRVKNRKLTFKPWLPENWDSIGFTLQWQGDALEVSVSQNEISFFRKTKKTELLEVEVKGETMLLPPNRKVVIFDPCVAKKKQ